MKINSFKSSFAILVALSLWLTACTKIEVFEKNTTIPGHRWQYDYQPAFDFTINDTVSLYSLYIVLRHTDAYRYNNIWLNIGSQFPSDTIRYKRLELLLGTDAGGWKGTGMDDIWENRIPFFSREPYKFSKAGNYKFSIAQVMRENPLRDIISVGVRVEKVKQ